MTSSIDLCVRCCLRLGPRSRRSSCVLRSHRLLRSVRRAIQKPSTLRAHGCPRWLPERGYANQTGDELELFNVQRGCLFSLILLSRLSPISDASRARASCKTCSRSQSVRPVSRTRPTWLGFRATDKRAPRPCGARVCTSYYYMTHIFAFCWVCFVHISHSCWFAFSHVPPSISYCTWVPLLVLCPSHS